MYCFNQKYGNLPSGSMVWFVNKVAREFPDKIISTLAYWYTERHQVIDCQTSISCCAI